MKFVTAILSFIFSIITIGKSKPRRKNETSAEVLRAKKYPPPFPNGWFNLCSTAELKKGQIKEINAFGEKLVLYRGMSGKVGVLDAYCPHLNANLADGKVTGDKLICPFHGWQFNNEGKCTHIPYSKNDPPAKAKTRSWIVKENWGLILVWYHGQGKEPTWDTDGYLPELSTYKYHGFTEDELSIHLQDFAENGADYAHFNFVHNLLTIPFASKFVHIKHEVEINFGEGEEQHMAWFTDTANLAWNRSDKIIDNAGGNATVTYFGPGFLAFKLNSKLAQDIILLKTFTPIGPLKLKMEDHVFTPKGTNRFALKYVLRESSAQFLDDILLWERKSYAAKPILVKGDGPIMQMRKWYRQFYESVPIKSEVMEKVGAL